MKYPDKSKELLKALIDADVEQKALAEELNVTPQAVNQRIRRGAVEPLWEALKKIKDKAHA